MTTGPLVAFLGPSLSHEEARALVPGIICLPPAAMGDVMGAVTDLRPHAIALVDGTFLANMSVFHKEILYAMDHGVWMLGASSMGALRAAECAEYGMIGVGSIYESLACGALEDDDEVALTHATANDGYRSLSDAMVTIRATIAAAAAAGLVAEAEAAQLAALQKERWFPERRLSSIPADAAALGIEAERVVALREFVHKSAVDPKRADAKEALRRLTELPDTPVPAQDRPGTVMSGVFSAMLARDTVLKTDAGLTITPDRMRKHAALHDPAFGETMRRARHENILVAVALWLGGLPTDEEVQGARTRLSRRLRVPEEELSTWAGTHDVSENALVGLMMNEALLERIERSWLGRTRMGEITAGYLQQARLAGDYQDLKASAALEHAAAAGITLSPPPSPRRLVASVASYGTWQVPRTLAEYVDEHEFGSITELLDAMSRSVRAHHALFGIGLVDYEDETVVAHDDQEPMMTRGR